MRCSPLKLVRFDALKDGKFFYVLGIGHKKLMKHVLPPSGSHCATNDAIDMVLIKPEVLCYESQ